VDGARDLAYGMVPSVIEFAIAGLLWLTIVGIVLFVGTLVFGVIRQRISVRRLDSARRPRARCCWAG
jgi:hypothetical protein